MKRRQRFRHARFRHAAASPPRRRALSRGLHSLGLGISLSHLGLAGLWLGRGEAAIAAGSVGFALVMLTLLTFAS